MENDAYENLMEALYSELSKIKEDILSRSKEEILEFGGFYTLCCDIVNTIANMDINDNECKLLISKLPLLSSIEEIYSHTYDDYSDYNYAIEDIVRDVISGKDY